MRAMYAANEQTKAAHNASLARIIRIPAGELDIRPSISHLPSMYHSTPLDNAKPMNKFPTPAMMSLIV